MMRWRWIIFLLLQLNHLLKCWDQMVRKLCSTMELHQLLTYTYFVQINTMCIVLEKYCETLYLISIISKGVLEWPNSLRVVRALISIGAVLDSSGLLIIRAVADPRNSGISAKFPKKHEIPRNPPEIFPNACRQNTFNTYLGY